MSLHPTLATANYNNVYYDPVKVIVNDWWVVSGPRNIEVRDISAARIVTTRHTINWPKHLLKYFGYIALGLLVGGIWELLFRHELGWSPLWVYGFYFIGKELWNLKKRSVEHMLAVHTHTGWVKIARNKDAWYLQNIAREIGRRLAKVAPDSIVEAVKEPERSTTFIANEPPTPPKPITYERAGVTIEPHQVIVHHRIFPVEDILRAEVRREVQPMSILPWVGVGAWLALFAVAIFVPSFWLLVIPMMLLEFYRFGFFGMVNRGVDGWRRTHIYTVVMETRTEVILLEKTSHVLNPDTMVNNINRIVKANMLGTTTAPQISTGASVEQA